MFKSIIESISTVTNQGAPSSFKFHIQDKVELPHSIFEMYKGKPKNGIMINIPGLSLDNTEFSIFVFRKSSGSLATFAVSAMRKLVSLRHPSILRVYDSADSDSGVFIATEFVTPLIMSESTSNTFPVYGVYQLMKGIQFLHEEAKLVHGNLDPACVFIDVNGGYRLAGFELARPKPDTHLIHDKRALNTGIFSRYFCSDLPDVDVFGFVLIIYYLFTHCRSIPSRCRETASVKELVDTVLTSISDQHISQFLIEFTRHKKFSVNYNFFKSNQLIDILEFFETIHLKTERESVQWLSETLPTRLAATPNESKGILLDMLLNNVMSITSLIPASIPSLIQIIDESKLSQSDFSSRSIDTKIIALIKLADRSVRMKLLIHVPKIFPLFDPKILESVVLIEFLTGLTDSHPTIREQTLVTLVSIASHVNGQAVEKKIIPHVIKLLRDPEPSIRTNAIVSLGKVVDRCVDDDKQFEFISQCVMNGLRDPFGPARVTAIQMLGAMKIKTCDQAREMAKTFVPALSPLLVDSDGEAAALAFDVLKTIVDEIRRLVPPSSLRNIPKVTDNIPPAPAQSMSQSRPSVTKVNDSPPEKFWADLSKPAVQVSKVNFDSFWDDIGKDNNSLI
jgi:SCY1-like protein 1